MAHSPQRYVFLDALRGVASLGVVCFHCYLWSGLQPAMAHALPPGVDAVLANGRLGVAVFFVLSGFVIAHAVGRSRITGRFIAQFAIRRSIRLDPPYWATLILGTAFLAAMHRAPTAAQFLAHVVYLQGILGYHQIVSVFWTLSYEVQFYLVIVMLLGAMQRWPRAGAAIAAILVAWSLAYVATKTSAQGVFIDRWYAFALGAATCYAVSRRLPVGVWVALIVSAAAVALIGDTPDRTQEPLAAVITAACIGGVGFSGHLSSWSGGRILQYLGRISYSLYLIHYTGAEFAKLGGARQLSPTMSVAWFGASVAIAIAAADVFYRVLERPSLRLSRSFAGRAISRPVLPVAPTT